jgi:hypothetical protein
MYQQCDSVRVSAYLPEDGPCETETCLVVVDERHEI